MGEPLEIGETIELVKVFMQAPSSTPDFGSGRYHDPWGKATTPGIILGVTFALMCREPLSFLTNTRSPDLMPLGCASTGLIRRRAAAPESTVDWHTKSEHVPDRDNRSTQADTSSREGPDVLAFPGRQCKRESVE